MLLLQPARSVQCVTGSQALTRAAFYYHLSSKYMVLFHILPYCQSVPEHGPGDQYNTSDSNNSSSFRPNLWFWWIETVWGDDFFTNLVKKQLTNYLNGLLVVEFFVPVEHPEEGEGGEQNEAYSQEHVARETGKINPLWDKEGWGVRLDGHVLWWRAACRSDLYNTNPKWDQSFGRWSEKRAHLSDSPSQTKRNAFAIVTTDPSCIPIMESIP